MGMSFVQGWVHRSPSTPSYYFRLPCLQLQATSCFVDYETRIQGTLSLSNTPRWSEGGFEKLESSKLCASSPLFCPSFEGPAGI